MKLMASGGHPHIRLEDTSEADEVETMFTPNHHQASEPDSDSFAEQQTCQKQERQHQQQQQQQHQQQQQQQQQQPQQREHFQGNGISSCSRAGERTFTKNNNNNNNDDDDDDDNDDDDDDNDRTDKNEEDGAITIHSRTRREPWYAACCRFLSMRKSRWEKLNEAWEAESLGSDDDGTSTKSSSHRRKEDPDATVIGAQKGARSELEWDSEEDDDFFWDVESGPEDLEAFLPTTTPQAASFSLSSSSSSAAAPAAASFSPPSSSSRSMSSSNNNKNKEHTTSSTATSSTARSDFSGRWRCIATDGLEAFLKSTGFSRYQRLAASKAPWPEWEFLQEGNHIVYTNKGALGQISEDFTVGGPSFLSRDGWKQHVKCSAHWEGDRLVMDREGPQGHFSESRWIDEQGRLQFRLKVVPGAGSKSEHVGAEWGRTFERIL